MLSEKTPKGPILSSPIVALGAVKDSCDRAKSRRSPCSAITTLRRDVNRPRPTDSLSIEASADAPALASSHARDRYGCQRSPDRVDEQGGCCPGFVGASGAQGARHGCETDTLNELSSIHVFCSPCVGMRALCQQIALMVQECSFSGYAVLANWWGSRRTPCDTRQRSGPAP